MMPGLVSKDFSQSRSNFGHSCPKQGGEAESQDLKECPLVRQRALMVDLGGIPAFCRGGIFPVGCGICKADEQVIGGVPFDF